MALCTQYLTLRTISSEIIVIALCFKLLFISLLVFLVSSSSLFSEDILHYALVFMGANNVEQDCICPSVRP